MTLPPMDKTKATSWFDLFWSNSYNVNIHISSATKCQRQRCHRNCYLDGFLLVIILPLAFLFMISLQTFRKALGRRGKDLTEKEVKQLFELQCKLADVLFDVWKSKTVNTQTTKITTYSKNGNCVTLSFTVPAYATI